MAKRFAVSDGELVLVLRPVGKGWYAVTSNQDPRLSTQAKGLEDAFAMARDALKTLPEVDTPEARAAALAASRPQKAVQTP